MDCNLPGSSVQEILQARILESVALSAWDLPDPGIKPRSPELQEDSLPSELPGNIHTSPFFFGLLAYSDHPPQCIE